MRLVTSAVIALAVVGVAIGTPLVINHDSSPVGTAEAYHEPGSWSNLTVWAVGPEDRNPGASERSYNWYMGVGLEHKGDKMILRSPGLEFQECTTPDLRAEGIARDGQERHRPPSGDDTSTETDKSIVTHRKESKLTEDGIWVDWYSDDDVGGDPPQLNEKDEVVVGFEDCLINTDEVGWHQMSIFFNGTGPDGEYVETEHNSHYFAICDCESREEAVDKLGQPPSREASGTATPGPEDTATPGPEDTATPGPEDTAESEDTATPGPEDTAESEDTATAESEDTTTNDNNDGGSTETPANADGPGFGAGIGLLALLLTSYAMVRQDG